MMVESLGGHDNMTLQTQSERIVPLVVSVSGIAALTILHALPGAQDNVTALLFSPTVPRAEILREAAYLGLPIRDLRWNGYLVEFDISDQPVQLKTSLARRVSAPAVQLAIRSGSFCTVPPIIKEN